MKILTLKTGYWHSRRCIKCNRIIGFTEKKKQIVCDECYKEVRITASAKYPKGNARHATRVDTQKYKQLRKELIEIAGHCALCGSKSNLTAHHIGGQTNIGLTCLCQRCHDMYEHLIKPSQDNID